MTSKLKLLQELREKTGAGMMDCKKALTESENNLEKAVDWLKTKGIATASKKSGRVTKEGLVAINVDGLNASALEINAETDFVAKNEKFQDFVSNVSKISIGANNVEDLASREIDGVKVSDSLVDVIASIGENITLGRVRTISVDSGIIVSYMHNKSSYNENLGQIAVLVALETKSSNPKIEEIGKQIAMHIAAARPIWFSIEDASDTEIQKEKDIAIEKFKESGKPPHVIEKMTEGFVRKFLEENVLLEQTSVVDGKTKIKDIVANLSKEVGAEVAFKEYVRFERGENIEKKEVDFAEEVRAQAEAAKKN